MQGNSELVVQVVDTLDFVFSVSLQLGSEVVLHAQQGFVNLVFVGRTSQLVLAFLVVVTGQEGPGVDVVGGSQLVTVAFAAVTVGVIADLAFGVDTCEVEAVDGVVCANSPLGLVTGITSDLVLQVGVSVTGVQAQTEVEVITGSNCIAVVRFRLGNTSVTV